MLADRLQIDGREVEPEPIHSAWASDPAARGLLLRGADDAHAQDRTFREKYADVLAKVHATASCAPTSMSSTAKCPSALNAGVRAQPSRGSNGSRVLAEPRDHAGPAGSRGQGIVIDHESLLDL